MEEKIKQYLNSLSEIKNDIDMISAKVEKDNLIEVMQILKNTKELEKAMSNKFNQVYYGRYGTPTTFALEDAIAEIENGYRTIATSSGLSSISISLLSFLSKGDHCLISDCVYNPTKKFAIKILNKFGVKVDFYDPLNISSLKTNIQSKTKIIMTFK